MNEVRHDQDLAVAQQQERERDMQLEREAQPRQKEIEAQQQRMYLNRFYGRFAEPSQPEVAEPIPPPLVRQSNLGARHAMGRPAAPMGRINNPAADVTAAPMVEAAAPSQPPTAHIPTEDPAGYAYNAGGDGPSETSQPADPSVFFEP